MRVLNSIIIAFLVIFLAAAMAQAFDSNVNVTGNATSDENRSYLKPSTSRFYEDKSSFKTNLIKLSPAPQKYTEEVPPAGCSKPDCQINPRMKISTQQWYLPTVDLLLASLNGRPGRSSLITVTS